MKEVGQKKPLRRGSSMLGGLLNDPKASFAKWDNAADLIAEIEPQVKDIMK